MTSDNRSLGDVMDGVMYSLSPESEWHCVIPTTWFPRPQVEGVCGLGGFLANDHHECVSAPSEITRVWFYIYPIPQKVPKNSGIPHAKFAMMSGWCYTDGATTLRRPVQQYAWCHWGSRWHWRNRGNQYYTLCCIWYFYTTVRSPDSTGKILLSFLWNISHWRYCTLSDKLCTEGNISVHILKWSWRVFLLRFRKFGVGNHWSRAWDKNHDVTHQCYRSDTTSKGPVNRVSSVTSHPVNCGDNVYVTLRS
jgi:hypothetical protein